MNEPPLDSPSAASGPEPMSSIAPKSVASPVESGTVDDVPPAAAESSMYGPTIADDVLTGRPLSIRQNTTTDEPETQLHISTLWLPSVALIGRSILPAFIASLFVPFAAVLFFTVCFGLLPTAVFHILRFLTFRYRLSEAELILKSGILVRRERRIPFQRVQELEVHQGILHRVLDLAAVKISTAGSDAQEASMDVLRRDVALEIKRTINGSRNGLLDTAKESHASEKSADFSCQLTPRDLLLGGLTSTLVASLGAVVATIVYFQAFVGIGGRWMGRAEQKLDEHVAPRLGGADAVTDLFEVWESRLPDFGPIQFLVDLFFNETLSKSLALVVVGLVGSVLTYVIRYHGFRLQRHGDLLSSSYGLLALRRNGLLRDRIQALKLEEGLLRRYFGLAAIRVDSAGDRQQVDEAKKRDVLVPVARREIAEQVAKEAMPGLIDLTPDWRRISRLGIVRGTKKGWLLLLLAIIQTYFVAGWYCLIWLPVFPAVYFLNYQWYRHGGYRLDQDHFLSRKGWLNRATLCLPIQNIQNVTVRQSFFDRRLDLATLSLDIAGQSNTGGGPVLRHLPVEDARRIQRTLANRVARSRFTW